MNDRHEEDFRKIPRFVPSLDIRDSLERELADWVMQARSRRNWSLEQQITLLKKWNALWDKAIG